MSTAYTTGTVTAKPVTFAQRDSLRALRRYFMRLWKYNRPGSRRRELIRELAKQVELKLLRRTEAAQ